jgi:cytidylate kinase
VAILTVSRLYGSGGSEVAAIVARKLGWSLLDNEVVDAVAARLGMSTAEVQAREERMPSLVERLASAMTMGTQEWMIPVAAAERPTDEQLLDVTRHIIQEAIARGPVVVVGRGAPAMLAERTDALHVFCYAPRKALIARTMERDGLSAEAAAKLVEDTNRERERWVRLNWERDWRAIENYDLSVNTGRLGIEGASELIIAAARRQFGLGKSN